MSSSNPFNFNGSIKDAVTPEKKEKKTAAGGVGDNGSNNNENRSNEFAKAMSMESEITDDSNIRDMKRRIFVVTTAALPWRTGTAVNPLLRALYLTRGRPKHYVALVIPWLTNAQERLKLYGEDYQFEEKEDQEEWIREYCRNRAHCADEEDNLRIMFYDATYNTAFASIFPTVDICALIPKEEADIAILEEPEHLTWFRVPETPVVKELELPSSLSPSSSPTKKMMATNQELQEEAILCNTQKAEAVLTDTMNLKEVTTSEQVMNEVSFRRLKERDELGWAYRFRHVVGVIHTNYVAYVDQYGMFTSFLTGPALSALSSLVVRAYCHKVIRLSDTLPTLTKRKEITCNINGVRSEFLLASESPSAPSQNGPYYKAEVQDDTETDNFADVDDDFKLDDEDMEPLPVPTSLLKPLVEGVPDGEIGREFAPVYFIGKLIWAKGFDKVLELQEYYRNKNKIYFQMDIYGGGPDELAIKRAFLGRNNDKAGKAIVNGGSSNVAGAGRIITAAYGGEVEQAEGEEGESKNNVEMFSWDNNLRNHLIDEDRKERRARRAAVAAAREAAAAAEEDTAKDNVQEIEDEKVQDTEKNKVEVTDENKSEVMDKNEIQDIDKVEDITEEKVSPTSTAEHPHFTAGTGTVDVDATERAVAQDGDLIDEFSVTSSCDGDEFSINSKGSLFSNLSSLSIVGDITTQGLDMGMKTTVAGFKLAQKVIKKGVSMTFTTKAGVNQQQIQQQTAGEEEEKEDSNQQQQINPSSGIKFDPFQSRYEWRLNPLPTAFHGVKDHIEMKNISQHKIFLNMSITEVLCTTTAEALAMGKFVIIPNHPSNTFFYQFTNCLPYESIDECYEKLQWALSRDPEPLTDEQKFLLSWEGAVERLLDSVPITKKHKEICRLCGDERGDKYAARLHVVSAKRRKTITNFFGK